jgi:hypothetical protein
MGIQMQRNSRGQLVDMAGTRTGWSHDTTSGEKEQECGMACPRGLNRWGDGSTGGARAVPYYRMPESVDWDTIYR